MVQLYERLERPLYNVAYRYVWSAADAREVVQEAFLRLWRMRPRVRLDTVEPLLFRIAINAATSRLRRRRLWRWVSLGALGDRAAEDAGPERRAIAADAHARMRRALGTLPADLRQVVILCELSELSYAEVAEVLGVPAGTVASRRHRALERLRRTLSRGSDD